MRRSFQYNIITKEWEESFYKTNIEKDIYDIPLLIVADKLGEKYVWIKNQKKYEPIYSITNDTVTLKNGQIYHGIIEKINEENTNISAIARWNVNYNANTGIVSMQWENIYVDLSEDNSCNPISIMPCYSMNQCSYCTVSFQLRLSRISYSPSNFYKPSDFRIPECVYKAALEFLQIEAKKIYSISPTLISHMDRGSLLTAFVYRPLDPHLWLLRNFIVEFDKMFPKDRFDNYTSLCNYFNIVTPPKSLRYAYTFNAYALVIYGILTNLGFKDINLIRPFLKRTDIFGFDLLLTGHFLARFFPFMKQYPEMKTRLNHEGKDSLEILFEKGMSICQSSAMKYDSMISQLEIDTLLSGDVLSSRFDQWERLKFFIEKQREYYTDKHILHRMLKKHNESGWGGMENDTLYMYYNNYEDIPPLLEKKILHDGPTKEIHDQISEILRIKDVYRRIGDYADKEIPYSKYEEALEYSEGCYEIKLLHTAEDLIDVGDKLANCVGSYIKRAFDKETIIMVMVKDNEYKVCIELLPQINGFILNQAYGKFNHCINKEESEICSHWVVNKNLSVKKGLIDL